MVVVVVEMWLNRYVELCSKCVLSVAKGYVDRCVVVWRSMYA